MSAFIKTDASIEKLDSLIKPFSACGEDWFLVTAGHGIGEKEWNTMTCAWGGFGYLWEKPVAYVYIRPTRHTAIFTEEEDVMSLSFFDSTDDAMREKLKICGTVSGRDCNKAEKAGLAPVLLDDNLISFEEARLVFECRKLYRAEFDPDNFLAAHIILSSYPERDFHYVYVCEILSIYEKDVAKESLS